MAYCLREQLVEVPRWSAVTRDERTIDIEVRVDYRTVDPLVMLLSVADLPASVTAKADQPARCSRRRIDPR